MSGALSPLPLDGEGAGGWGDAPACDHSSAERIAQSSPHPNFGVYAEPTPGGGALGRAKRLRANPTRAETLFWKLLRRYQPEGSHWRRQVMVGGLVYDFGCHALKTLIEVDGDIHNLPEVRARDQIKAETAITHGYRLIRIANDEAQSDSTAVMIASLVGKSTLLHQHTPIPQPLPRKGEGERS